MDTTNYKPKQMRLREMPADVYDLLIDAQAEHKKKYKVQFSLEQTIYKLLRKGSKLDAQ